MMPGNDRYDNGDMPYYKAYISPVMPEKILDFHAHVWKSDQWNSASPFESKREKYMTTDTEYSYQDLTKDAERMFPDKEFHAVVFGQPTLSANTNLTNDYIASNPRKGFYYPLHVTSKGLMEKSLLKERIIKNGYYGYKVMLNWVGNDYGDITVGDMIGAREMEIADELSLVVMLHVPGSKRLADPKVQNGVKKLADDYPGAQIVLAHCGRCYLPEEMMQAVGFLEKTEEVCLDTSMVMDPLTLQILFERIDSKRVLFGTDLPVAAMRGRRVSVMDHWVDVVLEGYPESEFRVASDNIRATFMSYEIAKAINQGAKMAGIGKKREEEIYFDNGKRVLDNVSLR